MSCALAEGCVGAVNGYPTWTRKMLCDGCLIRTRNDIEWLPTDYYELSQIIALTGGVSEARIARPRPGSKAPIDLNVHSWRSRIAWVTGCWEIVVREYCWLSERDTDGVREGRNVQEACAILAPRVDVLSTIGDVDSFCDGIEQPVSRDGVYAIRQLRALHKGAQYLLGLTRRVVRLPGDCVTCGKLRITGTLRRQDGSDTVYCERCSGRWTYDDYSLYVQLSLHDSPAGEAAAYGVTPSNITR